MAYRCGLRDVWGEGMKNAIAYQQACAGTHRERVRRENQRILETIAMAPDQKAPITEPDDDPPDGWVADDVGWYIASQSVTVDADGNALMALIWSREIETIDPREDMTRRELAIRDWAQAIFPGVEFVIDNGVARWCYGMGSDGKPLHQLHVGVNKGLPYVWYSAAGHNYDLYCSRYIDTWRKSSGKDDYQTCIDAVRNIIARNCREYIRPRRDAKGEIVKARVLFMERLAVEVA